MVDAKIEAILKCRLAQAESEADAAKGALEDFRMGSILNAALREADTQGVAYLRLGTLPKGMQPSKLSRFMRARGYEKKGKRLPCGQNTKVWVRDV